MAIATPAQATELVMVNSPTCEWCEIWEEEIGAIYPLTEESRRAPIRRIDIDDLGAADLWIARPVVYTPTFILVYKAREVGRITGYPGDIHFWSLLDEILAKLPDTDAPSGCRNGKGGSLADNGETKGRSIC